MFVHQNVTEEKNKYVFRLSKTELSLLQENNLEARIYLLHIPMEQKMILAYDQRQTEFFNLQQSKKTTKLTLNSLAYRQCDKKHYLRAEMEAEEIEFFIRPYLDRYTH